MTANMTRLISCVGAAALLAQCSPPAPAPDNAARTASAADNTKCVTNIAKVIADGSTPAKATSLPAELAARLDAAVRSALPQTAAPGVIVGVVAPSGTWKAAYGKADPAKGTPMAVGMHTRIGSVTKTFTGTAIMQLAEAGSCRSTTKSRNTCPVFPTAIGSRFASSPI